MRYASLLAALLMLAAGCGGKQDKDPTTRAKGTLTGHLTPNATPSFKDVSKNLIAKNFAS